MTHSKLVIWALGIGAFVLAGCQPSTPDMGKTEQESLKNNMTRSLTPEEIARMGGGGQGATGTKETPPADAANPPKKDAQ